MTWQGIVGQDEVVDRFRQTLRRGRLASSYLFVGPEGVGKRTFAMRLAQTLFCKQTPATEMDPCGNCQPCQQMLAGTHPDLDIIALPPDKNEIPLALLIGKEEHRMKEGFCYNLSRKPLPESRKIGVIDDADMLNDEGSNSLLKMLEEPPPRSLLILIGTNPQKQLPTIRSRCQTIHFKPLGTDHLVDLLLTTGVLDDREKAEILAAQSDGGLENACHWALDELWPFRSDLFALLAQLPPEGERLGKLVQAFIDGESSPKGRRKRLRLVAQLVEDFYRLLLYKLLDIDAILPHRDRNLLAAASQAAEHARDLGTAGPKVAANQLERCLVARKQIEQNANPAALVGCWVDDLVRCTSPT